MKHQAHMHRLPKGADLLEALTRLLQQSDVSQCWLQVIGALESATLGYYDQAGQRYRSFEVSRPCEIASGIGNASLKDGEPFVHLHLVLGLEDGRCLGGHAMPGCRIFAAEACLIRPAQSDLHRVFDDETGLFLWDMPKALHGHEDSPDLKPDPWD